MHVFFGLYALICGRGFYYTDVILLLMSDEIIWKFREKIIIYFLNNIAVLCKIHIFHIFKSDWSAV